MKPKAPKDPAIKAAANVAKIEAKAIKKVAQIEASAKRRDAREAAGKGRKSFLSAATATTLIKVSDKGLLGAFTLLCMVGYILDMIFFWMSTPVIWLSFLLCLFGVGIRTVAIFGGVVLQWMRPETKPEDITEGKFLWWTVKKTAGDKAHLARMAIRGATVFCWVACAGASISFFATGHETRQHQAASIETTQKTKTLSKDDRIKALQQQIEDARKDRDSDVATAEHSIDVLKDNVKGVSTADNQSLQKLQGEISTYQQAFRETRDRINRDVETIRKEKEDVAVEGDTARSNNPPFLALYEFLASIFWGDVLFWTIAASLFFAFVLEYCIDTGLGAYFQIHGRFVRMVRNIEASEAVENARWNLELLKIEADGRMDRALAAAQHAEEQANAERQTAEMEQRVKKANAQAEAARRGEVYVDEDDLRQAEAERRKAEQTAKIMAIRADTEKLLNPKSEPALTPAQQRAQNAGLGSGLAGRAANDAVGVPVGKWSGRPDRAGGAV